MYISRCVGYNIKTATMADTVGSSKQTVYQQSVYNEQTNAYVHPDQISSHKQMFAASRYTAKNIPPSTFTDADSLVEFRIDPSAGNIDLMQLAWLDLTITNNDAVNTADVLPSFFLVNRMELYIAENLVETWYPLQLWSEYLMLTSSEQWAAKSRLIHYDPLTGNAIPNNIVPLGSNSFIIPLPMPHIAAKLPVSLIRQETQLRVYFNIAANVQSNAGSPATSLSLSNAYLYVAGVKYHPAVKALVGQALFGREIAGRFYRRNQTRNSVSLTAGSPYTLAITEFNGFSPDLKIIVRSTTNPQDNVQGWHRLTRVSNFDENGNPLSLTAQTDPVIEWTMFRAYPNISSRMRDGVSNKYIAAFPWADDVPGAVLDGLSSGDIRYKSSFSSEIVCADTGAFDVSVITYSKAILTIQNGSTSFRIVSQGDDARGPTQG